MSFINLTDDDKLFASRIVDLIKLCDKHNTVKYTNFLTQREQDITKIFANKNNVNYKFFGGHEESDMKICAFSNDITNIMYDAFPIVTIKFIFRKEDKISHRDILGSLMALKINRDTVGDILVSEGYAVSFVLKPIAEVILNEIKKIGKTGVSVSAAENLIIPEQKFEIIKTTISSLRIDCMVSEVTNLSREKSSLLIKSGKVIINGWECDSISENLKAKDKISIRGHGKYILDEIFGLTRKGKISISIKKFT